MMKNKLTFLLCFLPTSFFTYCSEKTIIVPQGHPHRAFRTAELILSGDNNLSDNKIASPFLGSLEYKNTNSVFIYPGASLMSNPPTITHKLVYIRMTTNDKNEILFSRASELQKLLNAIKQKKSISNYQFVIVTNFTNQLDNWSTILIKKENGLHTETIYGNLIDEEVKNSFMNMINNQESVEKNIEKTYLNFYSYPKAAKKINLLKIRKSIAYYKAALKYYFYNVSGIMLNCTVIGYIFACIYYRQYVIEQLVNFILFLPVP